MSTKLRIGEVAFVRRRIPFRLPFHVAGTTITGVEQTLVSLRVTLADGRAAVGRAAECPSPIWFDKARDGAAVMADLHESAARAAALYEAAGVDTAFGLAAAAYPVQCDWARRAGIPDTIAAFGPALLDRAVLDGVCRALGLSLFAAMRANVPALDASLCPDLAGFDVERFLAGLVPLRRVALRHTVGGSDPLTRADLHALIGDGLPETLEDVIAVYGNRFFKIKIGGDAAATIARLAAIAAVLDRAAGDYRVTIDGNEAFAEAAALRDLLARLAAVPALRNLVARLLYVEQPIARDRLGAEPIHGMPVPLLIDESDGTMDSFPEAMALGYAGTSIKTAKGIYKAVLNAARCARRGAAHFLAAEDLNHPAGIGMQQDLAMAALLGLPHAERNGHFYVDGMRGTPAEEQEAALRDHPDLYALSHGAVRLRIVAGCAEIGSLDRPGFAT